MKTKSDSISSERVNNTILCVAKAYIQGHNWEDIILYHGSTQDKMYTTTTHHRQDSQSDENLRLGQRSV